LLTWAAVGDVDGLLIQDGDPAARRSMLQRPGTLGITYSGIHPQSQPLVAGDLFLLTTDGVSRKYRDRVSAGHSLAETAQQTLRRFGSENDDCLVLAIGVEAEA
jgi:phosphoserine phosphatase RsbX